MFVLKRRSLLTDLKDVPCLPSASQSKHHVQLPLEAQNFYGALKIELVLSHLP